MTRVSAATDDLLSDLDGVAMARCINSGQITAVEAVGAAIARLQSGGSTAARPGERAV